VLQVKREKRTGESSLVNEQKSNQGRLRLGRCYNDERGWFPGVRIYMRSEGGKGVLDYEVDTNGVIALRFSCFDQMTECRLYAHSCC
jgi:hypothetical protein